MLIAESAMQSAGLSPLLFEVSLLLLAWYVSKAVIICPEVQNAEQC